MTGHSTRRRDVGLSVALLTGASGVLTGNAALFLASTVGLVYAAYETATARPEPEIDIEREVDPAAPLPDDRVTVRVTVENRGLRPLPDVRVIDGVPEQLRVIDGSPRHATSLEPDESASFTYTLRARRGEHAFRETAVLCRNLTGRQEVRETVHLDTTVECSTDAETMELAAQTLPVAGRTPTDAGGEGIAFHSVREYDAADPMTRIDWNRFARSGELSTIQFQERRAASVVLVVDTRQDRAPRPRAPTATQFTTYAAERLGTALLAHNDRVGAAVYDEGAYLRPRADRAQRRRLRRLLLPSDGASETGGSHFDAVADESVAADGGDAETTDGDDADTADGGEAETVDEPPESDDDPVESLLGRLPDRAQVVFCSPLLDDEARETARRFDAGGHAVTVVSPDVTGADSPGATIERLDRDRRIEGLRGTVRVIDWSPAEPLTKALLLATERWSR